MKTSILVQNLKYDGCAQTITNTLSTIQNISQLYVDVLENKVSFNYIQIADALEVKAKLKYLGYPSIEHRNSIVSNAKPILSCAIGQL